MFLPSKKISEIESDFCSRMRNIVSFQLVLQCTAYTKTFLKLFHLSFFQHCIFFSTWFFPLYILWYVKLSFWLVFEKGIWYFVRSVLSNFYSPVIWQICSQCFNYETFILHKKWSNTYWKTFYFCAVLSIERMKYFQ